LAPRLYSFSFVYIFLGIIYRKQKTKLHIPSVLFISFVVSFFIRLPLFLFIYFSISSLFILSL
jgi:hypothetical protein